jgi:hypothetical protein
MSGESLVTRERALLLVLTRYISHLIRGNSVGDQC